MKDLTLHLDALSPQTLSMKRLAVYLRELSNLCGTADAVHFDAVEEGSAMLKVNIEDHAYSDVINQARDAAAGRGPKRAVEAYSKLTEMMHQDKTDASLRTSGINVIQFPKLKEESQSLNIKKKSSVQGRLYSVGGKDTTVPVKLEGSNGETLHCEASIDIAEKLAKILFKPVRLSGEGEWHRQDNGSWKLSKLKVEYFEKLEDLSFKDAVEKLKSAGGLDWNDRPEAHSRILSDRG